MERVVLTEENIEEVVAKAADVLRQGGVLLYPTDTIYGLGVDSTNQAAMEKLFAIKGREESKAVSSVLPDIDAAAPYAKVTPLAQELADRFLPGKLTIILSDTFSVRVPASALCLALADAFGKPYTATSTNRAGEAPGRDVDAIFAQLGSNAADISLIIDAGELPESAPSTVVDARGEKPLVVREGAIPASEITSLSA